MSTRPTALTEALHDYLLAHGVRESAVMRRLREETARHEMGLMQISPEQGALMALLVELIGARRALEVGVFTGYSALAVAEAMGADGRLTALDIDADYTGIAQRHWAEAGLAERIELRLGDARESLAALRSRRVSTGTTISPSSTPTSRATTSTTSTASLSSAPAA